MVVGSEGARQVKAIGIYSLQIHVKLSAKSFSLSIFVQVRNLLRMNVLRRGLNLKFLKLSHCLSILIFKENRDRSGTE